MPIYEYRCKKCNARSEVLLMNHDQEPATCDKCGGQLVRLPSAPAIQFKGTGWYCTDYGHKDSGDGKHKSKIKSEIKEPQVVASPKTGE